MASLRFCPTGAHIPDDLIKAVREGSATFICGAGVSFRVGLPLFKKLTEDVYSKLGETWTNDAPERAAMTAKQYDRALRALEKRIHFPGTPSAIRTAVKELLAPPAGALDDHLALLKISKNREGIPRLLTTNFDTLFERAAGGHFADLPTFSGKSIPKAGGPRDYGIFHLHGCIGDDHLKIAESDYILTSADFGDAYLRDGWASHYIEDRMRVGCLVLVGYQAEDAAMRLLLETLDADRERFPDLKTIYAIEKEGPETADMWKSKGITPIEFSDYGPIYETLRKWAEYATDPASFGKDRIKATLMGPVGSS